MAADSAATALVTATLAVNLAPDPDLEANPALKWIRGHMKIAPHYDG